LKVKKAIIGRIKLKRELGLFSTIMLGVGGAISAGVFVTLGYASSLAGSSLIIVMVVGGFINLLTMMSFAELGTALPHAGGEYTWTRIAFDGFIPFATGWFEWTSNIFYASFCALGLGNLLGYVFPGLNGIHVAVLTIVVFTLINLKGIRETGLVQAVLVVSLLLILGAFIIKGLTTPANFDFVLSSPHGVYGILRASAYVFVIYLGGEAIVAAQAEVKAPKKTISRAIVLSCLILILFYSLISLVIFRVVSTEELAVQSSTLSFVAERLLGSTGVLAITFAGVIAALTSVNTSIMAQSRVAYALARDGYFPKFCSKLHSSFCTPWVTIFIGSGIAIITSLIAGITFVTYATDFGFIMGFIFVNLSVIALRSKMPNLERPFKIPLYPFTPLLGIATCLLLLAFLDRVALLTGVTLLMLSWAIYQIRINKKKPKKMNLEEMSEEES
jgi:APA family basic amino acid/polyamine antiporter